MASTISAGITTTTALSYSADTSGVLQLQTNGGTTALTLDTNQNVGVGVTPSAWGLGTNGHALEFSNAGSMWNYSNTTGINLSQNVYYNGAYYYKSTAAATLYGQGSGQHVWYNAPSGTGGTTFTPTQAMTLDTSGNLLVGKTSSGTFTLGAQSLADPSGGTSLRAATKAYDVFVAYNNSSTTTNNLFSGFSDIGGSQTNVFFVRANGNVLNTNNSYGAISDVKLKENILDATPKLADLMQVKVRNYNLKSDPTHKQLGVIAQELETVFPAMVEETPDRDKEGNDLGTTTKSVKYSVFVPMLLKAIQELAAQVTTLQTQVTALKG